MSIRSLLRAVVLAPALLLFVSSAVLAQGLDDKTAAKLLKSDLKAIEKEHKSRCTAALNTLKADLALVQDAIDAALEEEPPPPGPAPIAPDFLADVFAAYSAYAAESTDAERDACDDVATATGAILNDPEASGAYPPGFVIGQASGLNQTVRKVRSGSAKNADKAVKLAKKILQSLEKDLGYLAQVSLESSSVPCLAPVVLKDVGDGEGPAPYIERRAYGPSIDLIVAGRDPAEVENDRVFVAGSVDENQILTGVQAVLTGTGFQEAMVDAVVGEGTGRWTATIETIEDSDGTCDDRGCGVPQGNYIVSVRVDDLFEVTRAVGMP